MFKNINPYAYVRPGLIVLAFVGLIITY